MSQGEVKNDNISKADNHNGLNNNRESATKQAEDTSASSKPTTVVVIPSPEEEERQDDHTKQQLRADPSTPTPPTPVPWFKLSILLIVLLNEGICASMLFPFIGFYVSYLTGMTKEEAGYASGILLSMFMFGAFVSGKQWGAMSDVFGRKPIMMFALLSSGIVVFFFGLSESLWMAIAMRFVHGLCNGNIALAKIYITEITDKTNEARGFSVISIAWGAGCLIGPIVGGFLYDPGQSGNFAWMGITESTWLLGTHPAFLPCIVVAIYSFTAFAITGKYMEESHKNPEPVSVGAVLSTMLGYWAHTFENFTSRGSGQSSSSLSPKQPGESQEEGGSSEASPLGSVVSLDELAGDTPSPENSASNSRIATPAPAGATVAISDNDNNNNSEKKKTKKRRVKVRKPKTKLLTYGDLWLREPVLRLPVQLYVGLCAADFAGNELLPLWLITSPQVGGLEMTAPQIGFITVIMGVAGLLANLVFPTALKMYGDRKGFFQLANLYWAISIVFTPFSAMCFSRNVAIFLVVFMTCGRMFFSSWTFAQVQMLIAAVAPREQLGAIAGMAQASGSFVRAVVPVAITPAFAFSIGPYRTTPVLDYYTTFIIVGLILVANYWSSRRLVKTIRDD